MADETKPNNETKTARFFDFLQTRYDEHQEAERQKRKEREDNKIKKAKKLWYKED